MGAFDSFGRSLNAIFEKRPPWPARRVSCWNYDVLPIYKAPALWWGFFT
jgi:hypothetical protein